MAHFSSIFGGLLVDGVSALTAAQMTALDSDHTASINGDGGGTWAPSSTIVVGGAGLQFTMPTGVWPGFVAGTATLTRWAPCVPLAHLYSGGSTPGIAGPSWVQGAAAGPVFASRLDLSLPNNATLTSVVPYFKPNNMHSALPTTGPSVSIQRIADKTQTVSYLNSADTGGGIAMTLPASFTLYNALGVTGWNGGQYTCNQFNLVDRTQYYIIALMYDEAGAGALPGNMFSGFAVTFTISDMEPS
jgi:hypothetical protein